MFLTEIVNNVSAANNYIALQYIGVLVNTRLRARLCYEHTNSRRSRILLPSLL